jgi:hypothetical protein
MISHEIYGYDILAFLADIAGLGWKVSTLKIFELQFSQVDGRISFFRLMDR